MNVSFLQWSVPSGYCYGVCWRYLPPAEFLQLFPMALHRASHTWAHRPSLPSPRAAQALQGNSWQILRSQECSGSLLFKRVSLQIIHWKLEWHMISVPLHLGKDFYSFHPVRCRGTLCLANILLKCPASLVFDSSGNKELLLVYVWTVNFSSRQHASANRTIHWESGDGSE